MATLISLPTELLRNIFVYLEPKDVLNHSTRGIKDGVWTIEHFQRTLGALARTCRRINPIANEFLYSRYEARYERPVLGYIERFDADHLIRKQLRHVKISGDLGPRLDEPGYWKSKNHSSVDNIRYVASPKRACELERNYCQSSSLFAVGTGFKENMNHHPVLLELANLVFRAENLETFWTENLESLLSLRDSQLVIRGDFFFGFAHCPRQAFQAGSHLSSTLRSLTLDMPGNCQFAMHMLLHYHALRELRLNNIHGDRELGWPAKEHMSLDSRAGTSKITILELRGASANELTMAVGMIKLCKVLERFTFSGCFCHDMKATPMYQSILAELLRYHRDSLKCLKFSWEDCYGDCIDPTGVDFLEFPRQGDFVKFTALKQLHVPMPLLTGRPEGQGAKWIFHPKDPNVTWETYLDTDKVLSPNLTDLSLEMGPTSPPALGWDYYDLLDFILRHNCLTHLELHWKQHWLCNRWDEPWSKECMLPIDFHEIKRRLFNRGCKLRYRIFVGNLFDFIDCDGSFTRAVDLVAKWLATYHGKAGIEMALHLVRVPRATLPRRVMKILGLGKDWLSSEEAKDVLFGQEIEFDATDDFCSQARWKPLDGEFVWKFPA